MPAPTTTELRDAWRTLCSTGTPPAADLAAKVLPEWSVGLDDWIDRLAKSYLRDYCLRQSHFKLVTGQYGGGKTHFLLAFRARALEEGFATCYLQCKAGVSLADWSSLYCSIAASIRLPDQPVAGIEGLINSAYSEIQKRAESAPNPAAATDRILDSIAWMDGYASSSFLRVVSLALAQKHRMEDQETYRSAVAWLKDGQVGLEGSELRTLGVKKIPSTALARHGLEMFYSLVRFLTEFTPAKGLVLLLDETDTMFTARGKALERLMAAMRTTVDQSDDNFNSIPVFGLFAAVPSINEQMQQYQALAQRFSVVIPFHKGSDNAPQIDLGHLGESKKILTSIGSKLLSLAAAALETKFDRDIQTGNIQRLVDVAEARMADMDSRRLFVKTWCAILDEQNRDGERVYTSDELSRIFQGNYQGFRSLDEEKEDDIG